MTISLCPNGHGPMKQIGDIWECETCKIQRMWPDKSFEITIDEARALNYLISLHHGLLKQSPDEYTQILRLINGLGNFVTSYDWEKNGHKKV